MDTLEFKKTESREDAMEVSRLLSENNIIFSIKEPNPFGGDKDFIISISPGDLDKATRAIRKDLTETKSDDMHQKTADKNMIAVGYLAALLGGVIGIIFGLSLMMSKATTTHGVRYPFYDDYTRRQGRMMVIIGAAALFIILIIKNTLERNNI